jgi:exosortase/archaeosortase family protein
VFGRRFTLALWFPLSYLALMLPIWNILTDRMHLPFQIFSAGVGAQILQVAGVPVYRKDNYLELPNITLEVASICSGVNYLIAVVAIGIPQAYLFLNGWLPRAGAIAFGLATAIFGNGLRVGLIGMFVYHGWSQVLHGPAHMFQGLFVSFVGFVALLGAVSLLARRYPRVHPPAAPGGPKPMLTASTPQRLALIGIGGVVFLLSLSFFHPEASAATMEADAIHQPPTMTRWRIEPTFVPARFVSDETGRRLFANVFVNDAGDRVEYYAGTLPYRMPDLPLDYRDVVVVDTVPYLTTIRLPDGRSIVVNRMTTRRDERRSDVVYWYELDGTITSQLAMAKAYTAWQLLARRGALPRLVVVAADIPNTAGTAEVLGAFATELLASDAH